MPVYNFDPTDDVDDWENQLLEEERSLRPEADKVRVVTFGLISSGSLRGYEELSNQSKRKIENLEYVEYENDY